MASKANEFVDSIIYDRMNKSVQHLLRNVPLSDMSASENHLAGLKSTTLTRVDVFKEQLRNRWLCYKEPLMDIPSIISQYECVRHQSLEEQNRTTNFIKQYNSNNPNRTHPEMTPHSTVILDLQQPYVQSGPVYYPINIKTGVVDTSRPLKHPEPDSFAQIEKKVLVSSKVSKSLHVLETLLKIIELGEERGYSRTHLGEIFTDFITTHIPSISGNLFLKKDATQIFECILNSVNFYQLSSQCKRAIQALTRQPGEPIEKVVYDYISLLIESSFIESPDINESVATSRSQKIALKHIKHFVSPTLSPGVEELRTQVYLKLDENVSLETMFRFINKQEMSDEFKLKTARGLNSQIATVSIFNTEYSRPLAPSHATTSQTLPSPPHSRAPSPLPGASNPLLPPTTQGYTPGGTRVPGVNIGNHNLRSKDQVKSKYRKPQEPRTPSYRSNRPSRSPTPQRSYQRTASSSPGSSRTPSRSPSVDRNRGRSSNNRSPSNGPLYYRSQSGNHIQRLSRRRIMARTGSGNFRNRRLSKSPQPRPKNRSKSPSPTCLLCGGSHISPSPRNNAVCSIYGRGPVADKECYNCKKGLRHVAMVCQHGPPIKNFSRVNSPSFRGRSRSPSPYSKN